MTKTIVHYYGSKTARPNGRLVRWQILMVEYSFTMSHISDRENIVADFLSRIKVLKIDGDGSRRVVIVNEKKNVNFTSMQVQRVALVQRKAKTSTPDYNNDAYSHD